MLKIKVSASKAAVLGQYGKYGWDDGSIIPTNWEEVGLSLAEEVGGCLNEGSSTHPSPRIQVGMLEGGEITIPIVGEVELIYEIDLPFPVQVVDVKAMDTQVVE